MGDISAVISRIDRRIEAETATNTGVQITQASSITPEPIDWLWDGWLAAGKLHVLAGAPGTGKTTLALALASALTTSGRVRRSATC